MPWQSLPNRAEILSVHAAYMGFGRILYFGGNEFDPGQNALHRFDATRLFDCATFAVTTVPSPPFDAFCSGHAFLGAANEAMLLAAGGTEKWEYTAEGAHHIHFPGLRDASIFRSPNPADASIGGWVWLPVERMNPGLVSPPDSSGSAGICEGTVPAPDPELTGGRWYPTLVTLPNGNVLALSGHPGSSDCFHNNDVPEVFSRTPEPHGGWRRLADYARPEVREAYLRWPMPLYPRLHLLPSGDIICTNAIEQRTVTFSPDVGPFGGTFAEVCGCPQEVFDHFSGFSSTSVLLPLCHREKFRARAMICGGTSDKAFVLDLKDWPAALGSSAPPPWQWKPTGPRPVPKRRQHANATLLPTGEIVVTGGIDVAAPDPSLDAAGVREPEIYDPVKDRWSFLADPAPQVRNYHSVAILMPDGRVWVAGSDVDHAAGLGARNLDIDIFEPWYHGNPDRPLITAAPSLAYPGQTIYVESTHAEEIDRVVLLRCGSCTHAFNGDQRLVEVEFRWVVGGVLLVTMPPSNAIIPPGPYFLYTIRPLAETPGLPSFGTDIYVVVEEG